ncbi:hypothetical protein MHZ90_09205 [Pantoea sp. ACRSH]|uniref:hypothetical protein n=1 Tax=unclassified Pantoea TaxID=2630326 RepID=UPI001EF6E945|nr:MULTISPECIES: hypothetical protein [unclassified Pantoea]MCG7366314.1 hypothetical protein [Pantoea sp. ACRSH]MCG7396822.1 hypothetical protein [Pantoea sp. ACRSC]
MSAETFSVKLYEEQRKLLRDTVSLGADFMPIFGTLKSAAETNSAIDYLMAATSFITRERVVSGILKVAEKVLAKGLMS